MKKRLILLAQKGSEEKAERALITLELLAETNQVHRHIIPADSATEDLELQLFTKWKKGDEIELPTDRETATLDLSASSRLLPDGVIAKDEDLLQRTQTEWIFIVLSTKLFKNYKTELNEIQEEVDGLEQYSKNAWNKMKDYWAKVQSQITEHNLFKEHAHALKGQTNEIFDHLKKLRSAEDAAFEAQSADNANKILSELNTIEQALQKEGTDLKKMFDKLKTLQNQFKGMQFTRATRSQLWERIDKAFKAIKEKRSPGSNNSAEERLIKRMDGLRNAIDKMNKSINRDKKELEIQDRRLRSSNAGQIETQLREVKAKLINERIASKSKKLEDMHKTMEELETRLKKMQERKAKEAEKAAAEKAAAEKAAAEEAAAEEAAAEEKVVEAAATTEVNPVAILPNNDDEDAVVVPAENKEEE